MVFNFFHPLDNLSSFCDHFSISQSRFFESIASFSPQDSTIADFAKILRLDLLSKTDNCNLVCRHITTCADNLESIFNVGLQPLSFMLQENTTLHTFLERYGIAINVDRHEMIIKDTLFRINSGDELCKPCPHGVAAKKAVRMHSQCCDFHEYMERLNGKLYHDKCEIEAYYSGSDQRMLESYQSILNGPEILLTIGDILHELDKRVHRELLQNEWAKQPGMKRYILELRVPVNAIETNSDYKYRAEFYDNIEWYEYAGYSVEQYYDNSIPLEFYRNKLLI